MIYLWDFGDNWEHKLFLLGKEDSETRDAKVVCVDGNGGYMDNYVDRVYPFDIDRLNERLAVKFGDEEADMDEDDGFGIDEDDFGDERGARYD